MLISEELKNKNIAEYLLYMWQIEDIMRAYSCNYDVLEKQYLSQFLFPEDIKTLNNQWYANLCELMIQEGVKESGHLSINKDTLERITSVHKELLQQEKPSYKDAYNDVLPFIVQLRAKNNKTKEEIETCFDALYGSMLLRLQKKEISKETTEALSAITKFLSILSEEYIKKEVNNDGDDD